MGEHGCSGTARHTLSCMVRTTDELVERVLRAVELIPAGRVVSYGDLAALVGIGPRQVGAIMGAWGSGVPWWRVVNASGDLPHFHLARARTQWRAEGIAVKASGNGCRISQHRADLGMLADAWERACADLDGSERASRVSDGEPRAESVDH